MSCSFVLPFGVGDTFAVSSYGHGHNPLSLTTLTNDRHKVLHYALKSWSKTRLLLELCDENLSLDLRLFKYTNTDTNFYAPLQKEMECIKHTLISLANEARHIAQDLEYNSREERMLWFVVHHSSFLDDEPFMLLNKLIAVYETIYRYIEHE